MLKRKSAQFWKTMQGSQATKWKRNCKYKVHHHSKKQTSAWFCERSEHTSCSAASKPKVFGNNQPKVFGNNHQNVIRRRPWVVRCQNWWQCKNIRYCIYKMANRYKPYFGYKTATLQDDIRCLKAVTLNQETVKYLRGLQKPCNLNVIIYQWSKKQTGPQRFWVCGARKIERITGLVSARFKSHIFIL